MLICKRCLVLLSQPGFLLSFVMLLLSFVMQGCRVGGKMSDSDLSKISDSLT